MNITVSPSTLSGRINAIPSKSYVHRLLIRAALLSSPSVISLPRNELSDDILATIECLKSLGAIILVSESEIVVNPIKKLPQNPTLDCRSSASTLRFLLPVACALLGSFKNSVTFVGTEQLANRPLSELCDTLEENGIIFSSKTLPLTVSGRLNEDRDLVFKIPGNISSQYISGLLFAVSVIGGNSSIQITSDVESTPYALMTKNVIKYFSGGSVTPEGDWSAAAPFVVLGALGHEVMVDGLNFESAQGDREILNLLFTSRIDLSDTPDLFPSLAVYAMFGEEPTTFTGVERLRFKESDRVESVCAMIEAIGGNAEDLGSSVIIYPKKPTGGTINSSGDHRIVMAATIAGLMATSPVTISGAEAVAKSYPSFFDDISLLGGKIDAE